MSQVAIDCQIYQDAASRKIVVKQRQLCFIVLGKHQVSDCPQRRCQKCSTKHHTTSERRHPTTIQYTCTGSTPTRHSDPSFNYRAEIKCRAANNSFFNCLFKYQKYKCRHFTRRGFTQNFQSRRTGDYATTTKICHRNQKSFKVWGYKRRHPTSREKNRACCDTDQAEDANKRVHSTCHCKSNCQLKQTRTCTLTASKWTQTCKPFKRRRNFNKFATS